MWDGAGVDGPPAWRPLFSLWDPQEDRRQPIIHKLSLTSTCVPKGDAPPGNKCKEKFKKKKDFSGNKWSKWLELSCWTFIQNISQSRPMLVARPLLNCSILGFSHCAQALRAIYVFKEVAVSLPVPGYREAAQNAFRIGGKKWCFCN